MKKLFFLFMGTLFGLALSRSGATDYNFIQKMFLFTDFQLYGIIGSAVALTAPGLWLLKKYGRTVTGDAIAIKKKSVNRGNIVGGVLFGIGWSLTGMCPGPIIVNIGEGKLYALAAFAGALTGAYLFGAFYGPIAKLFGLKPLEKDGTGPTGREQAETEDSGSPREQTAGS